LDAEGVDRFAGPRRPTRRRAALVITPIIVLVVCSNLGNAFFPTLVTQHPLLLIALSPTNRNFVLVSNRLDPLSFYGVGFVRLMLPDPFFFLLGRWYGENAILWMERRTPTFGQLMRTLERWFAKASWPLVTAIPNNPVSLLAGAAAMSVLVFTVLDIVGTIGRLVLLRVVGDIFSGPITWFVDLVGRYRLPLLALTITVVIVTSVREWRAGTSEIEQLLELEHEAVDDGDPPEQPHGHDPHQ
jgi:membrane protein DedA with SNARE-associated domain